MFSRKTKMNLYIRIRIIVLIVYLHENQNINWIIVFTECAGDKTVVMRINN
jgi:hypothetical protein